MSITTSTLLKTFPTLCQLLKGDESSLFTDVCSPTSIASNSIVFLNDSKYLTSSLSSEASILVIGAKLRAQTENLASNKTILVSPNPTFLMSQVLQKFFLPKRDLFSGIHSTAVISASAQIGENVTIGPFCNIASGVKIGANSFLQANVTIEEDVQIGENCHIMSNTFIGYKTLIGSRVEIKPGAVIATEGFGFAPDQNGKFHRIPQRGIVVIEDDVSIGANTCIDRATFEETRICEGVKLDNKIHVGHNCRIGKHSVLSGGSVLAGSSILGNHVMLGGHSAVGGHLKIADKVQIGGMSGFHQDIPEAGAYAGRPLMPIKEHLKSQVLLTRLGSLFKDIQKIKKHLGINTKDNEES